MTPRFIKLTNGVIFDANLIVAIVRVEVNKYTVLLKDCPASPNADSGDVKYLESILNVEVVPQEEVPPIKTKLVSTD